MISLFRNRCKKFDFIHQTVSPREAHISAGALVLPVASFVYVTLPPGKVWNFTTGCGTKQAGHSQTLITLFICCLQE